MNELQIFKNEKFGEVRTTLIDGEPWFVGKDVAEILGYSNTRKALTDHVDDEDKLDGVTIRDSIGREQSPVFINESGLYSLILRSKLESAKEFKHWVTSEVLPSIRKTGGYSLSTNAKNQIAGMRLEIEELRDEVKTLNEYMNTLPLFPVDTERYQKEIKRKGAALLGGKKSAAYNNASIRGKVFYHLQVDVKIALGFIPEKGKYPTFKCLERGRLDEAIGVIREYRLSSDIQSIVDAANCN